MTEPTNALRLSLQPLQSQHWPAVREIYLEGIATGNATFETAAPEWAAWDANHLASCRLVAVSDALIIGWTALTPVSRRWVYSGVAEVSVYVAAGYRGLGVGQALLHGLAQASEAAGIWTLQATIFPENLASLAAHQACGFRQVGYRERIACLHGVWRDTLTLERRSQVIGLDS